MKCVICDRNEVPGDWCTMPWCDPCLTRVLKLRQERPDLTLSEACDALRSE